MATVAANAKLLFKGEEVGLIQNLSFEADHGATAVFGIGSPVAAELVPGFFRGTARFEEAWIDSAKTTMQLTKFYPHTGQKLTTDNFRELYFEIKIMKAGGAGTFEVLHDCMIQSDSASLGQNNNIIAKNGTVLYIWKGNEEKLSSVQDNVLNAMEAAAQAMNTIGI